MSIFAIREIPDRYFNEYVMLGGGNVIDTIRRDSEHMLRFMANLPPSSASLSIRFDFTPVAKDGDVQSRLKIAVICNTTDKALERNIHTLLERGPLSRFYDFKRCKRLPSISKKLGFGCNILRAQRLIEPLHSREFNDKIPEHYYSISAFAANPRNDYLAVDSILDKIEEAVVVQLCIEPTDTSSELACHTRYLSRLQSINRTWDDDQEDEGELDFIELKDSGLIKRAQSIKPLRKRDPLAEDTFREQQRFQETLRQPNLHFHFQVLAETAAVAHLIASVLAESAFDSGNYRLFAYDGKTDSFAEAVKNISQYRPASCSYQRHLFPGKNMSSYSGLDHLGELATAEELGGAFRMPVASKASPRCIRKNTDPLHQTDSDLIMFGHDYENPRILRGVRLGQFSKHIFLSGVPGSSKTTSTMNIALQLHSLSIPFLIIEPAKTEYRSLKTFRNHSDGDVRNLAEKLEIYTPGCDSLSPFRHNPLQLLPGISRDEHIGNLMHCFLSAMPLPGPLQALLMEALERVYEHHANPTIIDLVATVEGVLKEKSYSHETSSDIMAAIEIRLGSLTRGLVGKTFQCGRSIPDISHLMSVPAVIEFDPLSQEQSCLSILFILTSIREFLKSAPKGHKSPRYALIIEEAHNVVGRVSHAAPSADVADPRAFAAAFICRMLAELRALSVAVVIIDQLPSSVAPEVIKNTSAKLAFRQVAREDREELGASMLFDQIDLEEIARLRPGEAFLFAEGDYAPRKIRTLNLHKRLDFSVDALNQKILPYIEEDEWFRDAQVRRSASELTLLCKSMDSFDEARLEISSKLKALMAKSLQVFGTACGEVRDRVLAQAEAEAHLLKQRLAQSYQSFMRGSYRRYLGNEPVDPQLAELRKDLVNRFKSVTEPGVKQCVVLMEDFISRCQTDQKGRSYGKEK